eukprot:1708010-Amphidinium_carterae.1
MEKEITRMAGASCVLNACEMRQLMVMVEEMKVFMLGWCKEAVEKHPSAVVLLQYSGDCSPVRFTETRTVKAGAQSMRTANKVGHDFMVQQVFLSIHGSSGVLASRVFFTEPVQ